MAVSNLKIKNIAVNIYSLIHMLFSFHPTHPRKVTALTGAALSMHGPKPLKKPLTPSVANT
jgi:hypothetical protein